MSYIKNIEEYLINEINKNHGYIKVSQFMQIALMHEEFGYYQQIQPFGKSGDFITAPEISQLFGEIIGIWLAYNHKQLNIHNKFNLIEFGPGRGLMMQDIIRATKNIPNFYNNMEIKLIETSKRLREEQKNNINYNNIECFNSFDEITQDKFSFIIGNEFFDALPIDIYQKRNDQWFEQVVIFKDNQFYFDFMPVENLPENSYDLFENCRNQDFVEYSQDNISIFSSICEYIKNTNSIALFIDYGYIQNNHIRTLQALKKHKYHNLLENIGKCDITAHINFSLLSDIAKSYNLNVTITTQQEFLTNCGIVARNHILKQNVATSEEMIKLDKALHKLIDPTEMGSLFKAIIINKV